MPGRAACLGLMSRAGRGGLGSAAQAQGPGRVGREELKAGSRGPRPQSQAYSPSLQTQL